jgi:hypothetical protein
LLLTENRDLTRPDAKIGRRIDRNNNAFIDTGDSTLFRYSGFPSPFDSVTWDDAVVDDTEEEEEEEVDVDADMDADMDVDDADENDEPEANGDEDKGDGDDKDSDEDDEEEATFDRRENSVNGIHLTRRLPRGLVDDFESIVLP